MFGGNPLRRVCFTVLLAVVYVWFGYFTPREESSTVLLLFACSWGLTFGVLKNSSLQQQFWLGLLFRFLLLFALPWLSQDFYRFIWDGLLLQHEINPYAFTPNELMANNTLFNPIIKDELFIGMGELSAQHYSNYPPVNQLGFAFSVNWFPQHLLGTVVIMRLLIILSEMGLFFILKKLLRYLKLPQNRIGWYFLNPLVIIELTGNLHWEGVLLFFFVTGWWLLLKKQDLLAVISFAFSIATKLIPLLLLPVFARYIPWKRTLKLVVLGCLSLGIIFLPFFKDIGMENYFATLQLWFKNFEFNGSFYYIIRWIGYQIKGYNIIRQWGEIAPWIIAGFVLLFSLAKPKKNAQEVFSSMLLLLTIYYLMASIVHPWYVISLVLLSLFTSYRFPLVWSCFIPLSYITYAHPRFQENYVIIAIEYSIVLAVMFYEYWRKKPLFEHL
ncbi:MAG: mannosyltransferase [Flavobacteriaceae bacterium]